MLLSVEHGAATSMTRGSQEHPCRTTWSGQRGLDRAAGLLISPGNPRVTSRVDFSSVAVVLRLCSAQHPFLWLYEQAGVGITRFLAPVVVSNLFVLH